MRVLIAALIAFAVSGAVGKVLVPWLAALKAGQTIKEIGPKWHLNKQGTPTMGGIMFIVGILVALVTAGLPNLMQGKLGGLFVFLFALVYGGITASQKFLLQLAAAILFTVLLRYFGYLDSRIYIPFANVTVQLPWILYMMFAAFVMVGTVNAVNLTDGVDGLAAGVTMPVAIFFTVVAVMWGYQELGIFAAALFGSLGGFLIYNFHPAKVFMGDTGSLFLGGAVAGLAFGLDIPVALILVGIIYIAETLSDIIQVTYFKLTHGKRIFRMAPLHHHFEMGGWSEKKVFAVFTAVTVAGCLLAFLGVAGRFTM